MNLRKFSLLSLSLILAGLLCLPALFGGCTDAKKAEKAEKENSGAASSEKDATPSAKDAYLAFLRERLEDGALDEQNSAYCLRDLDGDGKEELLLKSEAKLTVYSFSNAVSEAGQHDFSTGTLRLFASGDPDYPGIFCFTSGGGQAWYRYLSLKEGKLSLEDLWADNYALPEELTSELGGTTEVSSDKKLIELSKAAYGQGKDLEFTSLAEIS